MSVDIEDVRLSHPDFRFIGARAVNGLPYVVFERHTYYEPTDEQRQDYRRRAEIVKANGGRMILAEYEIAGETPKYTAEDCLAMRRAIEEEMPEFEVADQWNGIGGRSYSVSIRPKRAIT